MTSIVYLFEGNPTAVNVIAFDFRMDHRPYGSFNRFPGF